MLRAEAPQMADALAFLSTAKAWPEAGAHPDVFLADAVPMRLARRANLERAQLRWSSRHPSRLAAFHRRLAALDAQKAPSRLRWHLEKSTLWNSEMKQPTLALLAALQGGVSSTFGRPRPVLTLARV